MVTRKMCGRCALPRHILMASVCLWLVISPVLGLLEYNVQEELQNHFLGNVPSESQLLTKYNNSSVVKLFRYKIVENDENKDIVSLFDIDDVSGVLKTSAVNIIDREAICRSSSVCTLALEIAVTPTDYLEIIYVEINIVDINDNSPKFPQDTVTLNIPELSLPGITKRTLPLATDLDSLTYDVQRYELISDTDRFKLETTTLPQPLHGFQSVQLVLVGALDREDLSFYRLKVVAYDFDQEGKPENAGYLDVEINVEDGNDNSPRFENATYEGKVLENSAINTTILTVKAHDADEGIHAQIVYNFGPGADQYSTLFGINQTTGEIYLKGNLDYEKQASFQLLVSAADNGPNSQPVFAAVRVIVEDLNDNAPKISVNALNGDQGPQVSEFDGPNTFVAYVSVTDPDSDSNGEFTCNIDTDLFKLEKLKLTQYKVVTATQFDHEAEQDKQFTITCYDYGTPGKMTSETVTVTITDENDNVPIFSKELYTFEVPENNDVESFVGQVNATDMDSDLNGKLSYEINGEKADLFSIDERSGKIKSRIIFDFETRREFMFEVIARDNSIPYESQQTSSTTVLVTVVDRNDEPPIFTQNFFEFDVFENQPIGMEIGRVSANDPDSVPFNYFEFWLAPTTASQMFAVDTTSGHLRTKASLDRETKSSYQLTVIAKNVGVTPELSSSALIIVNVKDENDNTPIIEWPNISNHSLQISPETPRGHEIAFILAYDLDEGENGLITYDISSGNKNDAFAINPSNGVIKTDRDLAEYEDEELRLVVTVTDHGFPERSADSVLNVFVNSTLTFGNASKAGKLIGGTNLTIVIALAVSSVVVIVILVVAIVMTKMQDGKNKSTQYRYRIEGIKVWSNSLKNKADTQALDNSASSADKRSPKKEVNFSLQDETDDSIVQENKQNHQMIHMHGDGPDTKGQNGRQGGRQTNFHGDINLTSSPAKVDPKSQKYWELSAKQLPAQQQQWYGGIPVVRGEGDAASSSSGEVSNTDSGRGPSEEGENSMNMSLSGAYNVATGNIRKLPPQVSVNDQSKSPKRKGQSIGNQRHLGNLGNNYQSVQPGTSQNQGYHGNPPMVDPRTKKNTKRTNSNVSKGANGADKVYGSHSNLAPRSQGPSHQRLEKGYYGDHVSIHRNQKQYPQNQDLSHHSSHSNSKIPGYQAKTDGCYGTRQQILPDNGHWDNTNDIYGDNGSSTSGSYILDTKDVTIDGGNNPTYNSVVV